MPVIATVVCSGRSNCRVLIGTMAGSSVSGGSHGYGQPGISGRSFTEPGVSDGGHEQEHSVAGDSSDIVGWYVIDDVVHGFWATVPPRTTAG